MLLILTKRKIKIEEAYRIDLYLLLYLFIIHTSYLGIVGLFIVHTHVIVPPFCAKQSLLLTFVGAYSTHIHPSPPRLYIRGIFHPCLPPRQSYVLPSSSFESHSPNQYSSSPPRAPTHSHLGLSAVPLAHYSYAAMES